MDSCERVMNLHVPRNAGNFFSDWTTVDYSRRIQLHGGGQSVN
jgi:hypothetical protein